MKDRNLVLQERYFVGGETSPPAVFSDKSRYNNGAAHSGVTWTRASNGLWYRYFNGLTDYVGFGDIDSLDMGISNFTINYWRKCQTDGVERGIITKAYQSSGYYSNISGTNRIQMTLVFGNFAKYIYSQSDASYFTDNAWHMVTILVNRTVNTLAIYYDSIEVIYTDYSLVVGGFSSTDNINTVSGFAIGGYNNAALGINRAGVDAPVKGGVALLAVLKNTLWGVSKIESVFAKQRPLFGMGV
jgi:hypothetical protein